MNSKGIIENKDCLYCEHIFFQHNTKTGSCLFRDCICIGYEQK